MEKETWEEEKITIAVIKGVEGPCLSINDKRVAGPKPWGGGTTAYEFDIKLGDLDFIRLLLASQKEKMLGVLEGMEIPIAKDNPYFKIANVLDGGNALQALENGYKMAVDDIKKKIDEEL